ncbi:MAG: lipoate--protein ligase family protein [Leptospirales bacterium]|nr:lipoate--protein ligase family protein [Leptospirales bacterium]
MFFEFLDLKPRNPYLGLALDEALANTMVRQGWSGGLRLWSNPLCIVLGRSDQLTANIPEARRSIESSQLRRRWTADAPVLRRLSGGGAVLHGPGNLNYSLFVSLEKNPDFYPLRISYALLLGIVRKALEAQGLAALLRGQSDLVVTAENGTLMKISGNAQFRRRGALVLHGTLIMRPELIERVSDYLLHPPREPDYRSGRDHRRFLTHLPDSFDFSAFHACVSGELQQLLRVDAPVRLGPAERFQVYCKARRLVYGCYARKEWIVEARSPQELALGA